MYEKKINVFVVKKDLCSWNIKYDFKICFFFGGGRREGGGNIHNIDIVKEV